MEQDELFERLWTGAATLEEWTAAVSGGCAVPVTDNIIAIHTGYLFGNATAIRTAAGLLLIDTGSRETASQTLAALRRWDDSPVHTVVWRRTLPNLPRPPLRTTRRSRPRGQAFMNAVWRAKRR